MVSSFLDSDFFTSPLSILRLELNVEIVYKPSVVSMVEKVFDIELEDVIWGPSSAISRLYDFGLLNYIPETMFLFYKNKVDTYLI